VPSRLGRTELLVLLTLLASGSAILFFRFFITVDGPMHVLHASVLEQSWTTPRYVADGIAYDTRKLDVQVGDLLLMGLLHLFSPETAHDLFAVTTVLLLAISLMLLLGACGERVNAALLWTAPFLFSFILLMGFLHFMLGVAVSLLTIAWFRMHRRSTWKAVACLSTGFALAWMTHRGAPLVLAMLAAVFLFSDLRSGSQPEERRRMRSLAMVGAALLAIALGWLMSILHDMNLAEVPRVREHRDLFILRALLMLDPVRERPMLLVAGSLLAIATGAAARTRWELGRGSRVSDAWIIAAVLFGVAPLLVDTPKTRLLFVVERCQWIAALALVMWHVSMLNAAKGWAARMIGTSALLCLPVHLWRILVVERTMAGLEAPHRSVLAAVPYLGSGNVVLPVMAETNWVLQHFGAFVTVRHDGVSFTRKEHLNFKLDDPPIPAVKAYLARMSTDRWWLPKHWRSGNRPVIDRILFIGNDAHERARWLKPWNRMLDRRYITAFDNGYVTVYALDRWGKKEEERRERERQSSLSTARKAS
jgi:hypothetical protein